MTLDRDTEQMSETPGPGRFAALDRSECLDLLRSQRVGRVGFHEPTGSGTTTVAMLPVSYTLVGDSVIGIVTSAAGVLARLGTPGQQVGFEIDDVDVETATGWSVLAACHTESIDPDLVAGLEPWAGGHRSVPIGLRIDRLSGRIVSRAE